MERVDERRSPRDERADDALIVPVGARDESAADEPAAIGTPVEGAAPAPIGTPVEPVADVPVEVAITKPPAPPPPWTLVDPAPPWTRVEVAPRRDDGVADGLTEDGALPPRPRPSYTVHLVVASLVVLACVLGAWGLATREQRGRERAAFLALIERVPDEALRLADDLPTWLGEDPEVREALARARERLAVDAARGAARRLLERAAGAETLDERLDLCDQAVRTDPTWSTPRARRAAALLLIARRDVAARLARDERAEASFEAAAPALREVDAALALVQPSRERSLLADLELQRARLVLAAPGDPAARRAAAEAALARALVLSSARSAAGCLKGA